MNSAYRPINLVPLAIFVLLIAAGFAAYYAATQNPLATSAPAEEVVELTTLYGGSWSGNAAALSEHISRFNPKGDDLEIKIGPKNKPKVHLLLQGEFYAGTCNHKAMFRFLGFRAERNRSEKGNCDPLIIWDLFNQVWDEVMSNSTPSEKGLWKYFLDDVILNAVRLFVGVN